MRKERSSKRVPFRKTVHFGLKSPPEHTSFVTEISEKGLCIKTNKVFPPGTKLYLTIEASDKSYEAEGVVVWAKKVPPRLVRAVKNGMGIMFTRVDQEWLDIYQKKLKTAGL
jgi:Tfp pilus assembly protein PilZ